VTVELDEEEAINSKKKEQVKETRRQRFRKKSSEERDQLGFLEKNFEDEPNKGDGTITGFFKKGLGVKRNIDESSVAKEGEQKKIKVSIAMPQDSQERKVTVKTFPKSS